MTSAASIIAALTSFRLLTLAKLGIAMGGAWVLVWLMVAAREKKSPGDRRTKEILLAILGTAAFAAWWNFGLFHNPGFIHVHEQYHYYMGAKYFRELGYTRLYHCAAVADFEDGFGADAAQGWIRNLSSNDVEHGSLAIADQSGCTSHFSPDRWTAFKQDLSWFRRRMTAREWRNARLDHGYNATPVWGLLGAAVTTPTQASDTSILALALIDPVLLIVAFGAIWWAFGWQSLAVALLWWGINYPARFQWTGGGLLRTDWLLATVLAICFAKRGRFGLSGAALGYATLLRLFPALMVAGLVVNVAVRSWGERKLSLTAADRRFAFGAIAVVLVLVPLSGVGVTGSVRGGWDAWAGFVANTRKHLDTPLSNNVGLIAVVTFDPASSTAELKEYGLDVPWDTWRAARQRVLRERRPLLITGFLAYIALFSLAVRRREPWICLALGAGLIPIATQLTSYYYAVMLVYGLLLTLSPLSAVALTLVAGATLVVPSIFGAGDTGYAVISLLIVILVATVTGAFARRPAPALQVDSAV